MAEPLIIAKSSAGTELSLLPALANRHGLITGATGTGKTVSLQVLTDHFSSIGVPVFLADVKGDLSGVAAAGTLTPKLADRLKAIGAAARELDELRNRWLNLPEWTRVEVLEFPGSTDGPWRRHFDPASVDERGVGTVRYPRIVAKDEEGTKQLKKRTLTNLYNERPTWLALAHEKLDAAVFAAYGWDAAMSDDELLAALLALNLERAAAEKGTGEKGTGEKGTG